MPSICFYFQVHQPYRIQKYPFFQIGKNDNYFGHKKSGTKSILDEYYHNSDNQKIFHKVAEKCYYPTNNVLLELLRTIPEFKISLSLSGVFLEQAMQFDPDVIESFKQMVDTGKVEILSETYYHSLAFLHSKKEFREQVKHHGELVQELFGVTPRVFRNTELIYNNELAVEVENLGYKGVVTEGADHILGWRSPDFLYTPKGTNNIKLLLKNYKLSDDIAFRFSNQGWEEHPLSSEKFAHWINQVNGNGEVVNLFMDYETFGEHQWHDSGIFDFLRHLPEQILKHPDNTFATLSEAVDRYQSVGEVDIHNYISWADSERDLSAWASNDMQRDAFRQLYKIEKDVRESKDENIVKDWRLLQTSDHFYYMCTKFWADGDVHAYFSPYESPYEAFIYFMNALQDLKLRLQRA
jgi:alpha-amylase